MDFTNESYIRVYIRDTTTWKRLGWDGTCVLMHVLRKMDLSGVLDLGELEPWEAAVLHCGAPEPSARAGMERCLKLGCFVHRAHYLVAPNYRAANEAHKSDRLRQLESRARRRLDALGGDAQSAPSHATTPRDDASHTVTSASRLVTYRHEPRQGVTNGHAPSQSVTLSGSVPVPVPDTVSDTGAGRASTLKTPPPRVSDLIRTAEQLEGVAQAWQRIAGVGIDDQGREHVRALLAREPDAPARFDAAARAFVDHMRAQRKRPVLRWLVTQWAEWSAAGQGAHDPDAQRRNARQAEQTERDERMRRELDTVGEPPPKVFAAPAKTAERVARARTREENPQSPAQHAMREAQAALRAARDRGAPEAELAQLTTATQSAQRMALNEQRQSEGLPPLGDA